MMSHVMGASGALFPGLGGPQPAAISQHNLLSQLGLFSSRPGNYGENIVTVTLSCVTLCHASHVTHTSETITALLRTNICHGVACAEYSRGK